MSGFIKDTSEISKKSDETCALLSIIIWQKALDLFINEKDFREDELFKNLKFSINYLKDTQLAQVLRNFSDKPEINLAKNIKLKIENSSDFKKAEQQLDFKTVNLNKNYFLGNLFGLIKRKSDD